MEERSCTTCKYRGVPPIGDPCKGCTTLERWEPKFIPAESPFPVVGFDPGAPEGDKTNIRRVWPLDGREIFGPKVWIDDTESGPELIVPPLTQVKILSYAIDGIKEHVQSLGLLLTDRTLSADALTNTILELQDLSRDWDRLEVEREALRKAGEHVKDRDA